MRVAGHNPVFVLLAVIAMLRIALFRLERADLQRSCTAVVSVAERQASSARMRRLFRAELARVAIASLLIGLTAEWKMTELDAIWGGVAVALLSYLAESTIVELLMGRSMRGKFVSVVIGASLTTVVACVLISTIDRWSWTVWLLAMTISGLAAIGVQLNCEWIWWRPHRECRVPIDDPALLAKFKVLADISGLGGVRFLLVKNHQHVANMRAESDWRGQRIVIWPELLTRLNDSELEAVVLHELGHLVLRHASTRILVDLVLVVVALLLSALVPLLPGTAAELPSPLYVAAIAVWFPLLASCLRCAQLMVYRQQELAADRFVIERGRGRELATALLKLSPSMRSALKSHRFHRAAYDSHPAADTRLKLLLAEA